MDAQGHEIISAKIASTVHDTFHALMLTELDRDGKTTPELQLVQFRALGLEIPEDNPDRNTYWSLAFRQRQINSSDVGQITLMSPGDIIFLYSDGVYDGSDEEARAALERIVREHKHRPAKDICSAILAYALEQDEMS